MESRQCPSCKGYDILGLPSTVLDDLLYAFMGLDGKYVRATRVDQPDGAHITFNLETRADSCLQELATRMLPIW
jgi:hypothetical protein